MKRLKTTHTESNIFKNVKVSDQERDDLLRRKLELKYILERVEREDEEKKMKEYEERLQRDWELKRQLQQPQRSPRQEFPSPSSSESSYTTLPDADHMFSHQYTRQLSTSPPLFSVVSSYSTYTQKHQRCISVGLKDA
jgi:hypothetical protein